MAKNSDRGSVDYSGNRPQDYDRLLRKLDQWLHSIRTKYADQLQCMRGCSICCHGLFDISIPDALRVAESFKALPQHIRASVAQRASLIQNELNAQCTDLEPPYFLDRLSEERIDQLVEAIGDVGCPCLDARDSCLIYDNRPIACRLEGIPMVDIRDGLFGDWCELNFQHGMSPIIADDLRLDYGEVQEIEKNVSIFIPSVIFTVANGSWDRYLEGIDGAMFL